MSQEDNRQRLQRTKPLPNKLLGELIREVNLLPSRAKLPSLDLHSWELGDEDNKEAAAKATIFFEKIIKNLSEEFQRYIWHGVMPHETPAGVNNTLPLFGEGSTSFIVAAVKRYERFIDLHYRFHTLALYVSLALEVESIPPFKTEIPIPRGPYSVSKPHLIKITIKNGGRLYFTEDDLYKALQGAELRRIRRCEVCGSIFWAGRFDKRTCSAKCKNIYHVRRLRERRAENPEFYREKRRQNETAKAEMERKREVRLRRERVKKLSPLRRKARNK